MMNPAARHLSQLGRKGDTTVGHLTPGELVIPQSAQTPELMQLFQAAMRQKGINPLQYMVGTPRNQVNPQTGIPEFADDDEVWYSNGDDVWYNDYSFLDEGNQPYVEEEPQEYADPYWQNNPIPTYDQAQRAVLGGPPQPMMIDPARSLNMTSPANPFSVQMGFTPQSGPSAAQVAATNQSTHEDPLWNPPFVPQAPSFAPPVPGDKPTPPAPWSSVENFMNPLMPPSPTPSENMFDLRGVKSPANPFNVGANLPITQSPLQAGFLTSQMGTHDSRMASLPPVSDYTPTPDLEGPQHIDQIDPENFRTAAQTNMLGREAQEPTAWIKGQPGAPWQQQVNGKPQDVYLPGNDKGGFNWGKLLPMGLGALGARTIGIPGLIAGSLAGNVINGNWGKLEGGISNFMGKFGLEGENLPYGSDIQEGYVDYSHDGKNWEGDQIRQDILDQLDERDHARDEDPLGPGGPTQGGTPVTPLPPVVPGGPRTFTPPADYYRYGSGPEHTFFSGTPPNRSVTGLPPPNIEPRKYPGMPMPAFDPQRASGGGMRSLLDMLPKQWSDPSNRRGLGPNGGSQTIDPRTGKPIEVFF